MAGTAVDKNRLLERFAWWLRKWLAQYPARAGEIRGKVCAARGLSEDEFNRWVFPKGVPSASDGSELRTVPVAAEPAAADVVGDGEGTSKQPNAPPGEPLGRGVKPIVANYYYVRELQAGSGIGGSQDERDELKRLLEEQNSTAEDKFDELKRVRINVLKGITGAVIVQKVKAKNIDELREDVRLAIKGWPYRLTGGGLFRDRVGMKPQIILPTQYAVFSSLLFTYADLKFKEKFDHYGSNYVGKEALFQSFLTSEHVREFLSVETRPFWPELEGHYVSADWEPKNYKPDGMKVVKFLSFFDNVKDSAHRALLAASLLTLGWGGIYGERPVFCYEADCHNSGKSTCANAFGQIMGGVIGFNGSRTDDEKFKERLLSDDGLTQRMVLWDNVKRYVDSELLEELVTCRWISGRALYKGGGSRPNTLTYFLTGNKLRVSADFVSRCYRVFFGPPVASSTWKGHLEAFIAAQWRQIMADIKWLLQRPTDLLDWDQNPRERFAPWGDQVLAKVCQFEPLAPWLGNISAEQVLAINNGWRSQADLEKLEANAIYEAVMDNLCAWRGYSIHIGPANVKIVKLPEENGQPCDEWVRAQGPSQNHIGSQPDGHVDDLRKNNMLEWMRGVLPAQKLSLSVEVVRRIIDKHRGARRMDWCEPHRMPYGTGYTVFRWAIEKYLEDRFALENAT